MTVLSQAFLSLVCSHLVFLSFFTAWHNLSFFTPLPSRLVQGTELVNKLFKFLQIGIRGCFYRGIRIHFFYFFKLLPGFFFFALVHEGDAQ